MERVASVCAYCPAGDFADEGRRTELYGRRARWRGTGFRFLETYGAFVALALALQVSGKAGGLGATGAMLWFWARVAYVPAYSFGIPYLRSIIWAISVAGLAMMLVRLLG